jgi:hypothetical protein
VRAQPGLLALELAWRWLCGGLLLAVAWYAGSRIWVQTSSALHAAGAFSISGDTLLSDPAGAVARLGAVGSAAYAILWPPVERACLGLAPLALFCWTVAFAFGRSAVLQRYDRRLYRRVWIFSVTEAIRIASLFGFSWLWTLSLNVASRLSLESQSPSILLYTAFVVGSSAVCLLAPLLLSRYLLAMQVLAVQTPGAGLSGVFRLSRVIGKDGGMRVRLGRIRRKSRRVAFLLALAGLLVSLIPSPFSAGAGLYVWWAAVSLLLLAGADAIRLASFLALLGATREARVGWSHRLHYKSEARDGSSDGVPIRKSSIGTAPRL